MKPCPGAPAGTKCAAGTDYLWRLKEFDSRPYGCCACRRTKAGGPTTALYAPLSGVGGGPYCNTGFDKSVPANTVVHFTGNVIYGYSAYGCPKNDYAEIVLPHAVDSGQFGSFFVPLADLSYCNTQRACGARAELGATCEHTGCCNVAAEGGHPDTVCYFPFESDNGNNKGSACGIRPSSGGRLNPKQLDMHVAT